MTGSTSACASSSAHWCNESQSSLRLCLSRNQTGQVVDNLVRFPLISAIQLHEFSIRTNHRGSQRVNDLFVSRFGILEISQAEELRDSFYFILRSGREFPMLKSFV